MTGPATTVPAKTVGVVGGGQLARMMQPAAIALGLRLRLLAEEPGMSAAQVIADTVVGDYTDAATLTRFARGVDVLTFDHEHVPTALLRDLVDAGRVVRPGPQALVYAQDKAEMRRRLTGIGAPCPAWRLCDTAADLAAFGEEHGWPLIAKTSRGGYDGHGVWKLTAPDQAGVPFHTPPEVSAGEPVHILAEEFVDFSRELSVLAVRGVDGATVVYPVSQTIQDHGICVETITPAPGLDARDQQRIHQLAADLASELDVVGVLAIELMQRADGSAVVTELAMRPHNTGHWSIDGAVTSQFENHLRAVAGLPLGETTMRQPWCVMRNVLGGSRLDLVAGLPGVLEDPGVRVQLYGKDVRPGRKVAHVTVCGSDLEEVGSRARAAAARLTGVMPASGVTIPEESD